MQLTGGGEETNTNQQQMNLIVLRLINRQLFDVLSCWLYYRASPHSFTFSFISKCRARCSNSAICFWCCGKTVKGIV